MKKKNLVSSIIALAVLFTVSTQVNAQGLSFGVKGEANMTNFRLDSDAPYSDSKRGIGGAVGGFLKYDFGSWFALQGDLMFRHRSSDLTERTTGTTSSFKSFGFELPVYAVFQFQVGPGKLFAGIGPYAGYGVSAKTGSVNMYKKDATGEKPMEPFSYGAAAMLGYEFGKHWQVNASYISEYGIGWSMGGTSKMKSQTLSLGVGYRF